MTLQCIGMVAFGACSTRRVLLGSLEDVGARSGQNGIIADCDIKTTETWRRVTCCLGSIVLDSGQGC